MLPIGAYYPDSFRHVHMGPDEAIKAFGDLAAKWLVPMHYGTFKLSFEDMDEPPRWLKELAASNGLIHHLRILQEGSAGGFLIHNRLMGKGGIPTTYCGNVTKLQRKHARHSPVIFRTVSSRCLT